MTDWTPHDGGPCPVDPETIVRVKNCLGDRTEIHGPGLAQHMDWGVVEFYRPEPNWREIADELAAAAKDMLTKYQPAYHDCIDSGEPPCCLCNAEVSLTTYNQAKELTE